MGNSDYSSGTDVGTAAVADDVDAAEAGFNTDNYATYARCGTGSESPSPTPSSPSPSSPSPTPTPSATPAYNCPTTGGRTIRLSSLDQGSPFNECICIGDWNTKNYNDDIYVVPREATGCCPIGSVPGTQATRAYQGAQIVCGFTPDGSINLNLNTAFACDYEQCYVDKQNIPCCAGSPSGSGDVTDAARLDFADSASCTGYTAAIFTVHSFTDFFEYCTHFNENYGSCSGGANCVGTVATADDITGAEAGFNTDSYGTYQRCVGGSTDYVDSGSGKVGLTVFVAGLVGFALQAQ